MIAALYADLRRGPYAAMPDVDAWGLPRDARLYDGPHPVVAHPPCAAWGAFRWHSVADEAERSCAPRAVEQVRAFGGVLEHPARSSLWRACGLPRPGEFGLGDAGWTLEVDQVWWGHEARKRTWLYIVGVPPEDVFVPRNDRKPTRSMGMRKAESGMPDVLKSRRHLTPPVFAAWLVDIARRSR